MSTNYHIGIIGGADHLDQFVYNKPKVCPPGFYFAAGLCLDHAPEPGQYPFPVYAGLDGLLRSHPEVNTLLVLGGGPDLVRRLKDENPDFIVLDRDEAKMFLVMCARICGDVNLYEPVLDQLPERAFVVSTEGRVLLCNRAAKDCGAGLDTIQDRDVFAIVLDSVGPVFGNFGHTSFASLAKDACAGLDFSLVDQSGLTRHFNLLIRPLGDNYLLILRDTTQNAVMHLRLEQAERLAAVGELSMYISHEIRNPLFAISGFANSLVRTKGLDESVKDKLGIILQESARLDTILKCLIDFSRPTQAGEGVTDLNFAAENVAELMRPACDKQGVSLNLKLMDKSPMIKGESGIIKQCLVNLVKNALEAMPDGGKLGISTGLEENYAFLAVEDTGTGIAPDILAKVFNPFFSTKGKGAGLGLAMTKKIVDNLGGSVELDSTEGKGTRVVLRLPPYTSVDYESEES